MAKVIISQQILKKCYGFSRHCVEVQQLAPFLKHSDSVSDPILLRLAFWMLSYMGLSKITATEDLEG